jgi:serine/threonine-protein kinase RsbW
MTHAIAQEEMLIPCVEGSEKLAVARAAAFAAIRGFSPERIENIKTALGEACLNAIEYSSPKSLSETCIVRIRFDRGILEIEVWNNGKPFDPPTSKPDLQAKIEGRNHPRGWGIFLIRKLADKVEFESNPPHNCIRMTFLLHPHNAGANDV